MASVRVVIAGEEYTLRTNADESYTLECAALVNERMAGFRAGSRLDRGKAAIMAALSLSDDILQQKARLAQLEEKLLDDAEALATRLDEVLEAI